MRLLSALFCPAMVAACLPRQDILALEVDGMDQAVAYWQIYTIVRPRESVRACARAQYVAQTIVPSRPHRHDFQRLSSRKRLQSSRPSETSACPAWDEYLPGSANSKSSSTLALGVTLVRKPRFTALHWPSNGVSLQKRRPKASTDDRPSTRKLLFFLSFSIGGL